MARHLAWLAIEFFTGDVIADITGIELDENLPLTIGQAEQVSVEMHLQADNAATFIDSTIPGRHALIAYLDGDMTQIVWGGIVTQRLRDHSNIVQMTLSTPEAYLDGGCYVGDYTADSVNQDTILTDLLAFASGTDRPTWQLNHVAPSTATQSVTYASDDDITVLSALQALSGVQGGPEWLITWTVASTSPTVKIQPLVTYGSRIGTPAGANGPSVVVELADLQDGSHVSEDFTSGQGANKIRAIGAAPPNAADSSVPYAEATATDLKGRPLWEFRYQPNPTVSDTGTLTNYAVAALSVMQDGTQPLALTIANDQPEKAVGIDWNIGDDIGWYITGIAFPTPVAGTGRCVGYEIGLTTVTPVLKGAGLS